jgi:hypothetical protein
MVGITSSRVRVQAPQAPHAFRAVATSADENTRKLHREELLPDPFRPGEQKRIREPSGLALA